MGASYKRRYTSTEPVRVEMSNLKIGGMVKVEETRSVVGIGVEELPEWWTDIARAHSLPKDSGAYREMRLTPHRNSLLLRQQTRQENRLVDSARLNPG